MTNKKYLEELVNYLNPSQIHTELFIYDLIIDSLKKYKAITEEKITKIINLVKEENKLFNEDKIKEKLFHLFDKYAKHPAFIFVLNYDANYHSEKIFGGNFNRPCIGKNLFDPRISEEINKIAYEDNAVLILKSNIIYATNVQLVDINPSIIYKDKKVCNPHEFFGFKQKVNSRHFSALGASYHLKGTIVYTLSETSIIRRFQKGMLTFSTLEEENKLCKEKIK